MNEKKVKTTVYIDKDLLAKMERCSKNLGYRSKNDFFIEAVKSHIACMTLDSESDLFTEKLSAAMENHTVRIEKRVSQGLYRYAVDIGIIMHILACFFDVGPEKIEALRLLVLQNMKKNRGRVSLEEIAAYQTDREN